MNTVSETTAPRIEALLDLAYRHHAMLDERHGALLRSGISNDHLPDELARMAFSLLGDHGRGELIGQVQEHWGMLQAKGLAQGAIEEATTAELRQLAQVLPFAEAIDDVWNRLVNLDDVPEPPLEVLRCDTRVQGLWGQCARLHFSAREVQHLLIAPEPIFGLQPALLAAQADEPLAGSFVFPIDKGAITLSLLHRNGDVFRHVVQVMIEER